VAPAAGVGREVVVELGLRVVEFVKRGLREVDRWGRHRYGWTG
jgi:hypothetical protein